MVGSWGIASYMSEWAPDSLVEGTQEVVREELRRRDSGSRLLEREGKDKV